MQLLAPVLQTVFLMLSPKNTHRPEKIAPTSWHVFTTLPDTFRQCPKSANLGLKAPANRRRTQPPLPARLNTLHLSSVFKKKKILHTSIFQFFLLFLQIFRSIWIFLSWGPIYVSRSMCPDVCQWVREVFADLTDVILADQATNLIQADNANMAIQGNVAMQVTQPGGKLWNQC